MASIQVPNLSTQEPVAVSTVTKIAAELDLAVKSSQHGVYKYVQNYPQAPLQVAGPSVTQQAVFQLSGQSVYNFSKSWLEFSISVGASGTGGIPTLIDLQHPGLDSVILQTTSGSLLAQVSNLGQYARVVNPLCTPKSKVMSRGPVYAGVNAAGRLGSVNQLCAPTNAVLAASSAIVPINQYLYKSAAGNLLGSADSVTADSGDDSGPSTRQRYGLSAANGVLNVKYKIPAECFCGSLLNYPKDIFLNTNLMLICNFAAPRDYMSLGTDVTIAGDTPTALAANTTYADLMYVTAVEMNGQFIDSLRGSVLNGGIDVVVPFLQSSQTAGIDGNFSYSMPIVPGQGTTLRRIISSYFASPSANQVGVNANVNQALYSFWQSLLDNSPLQPKRLDCSNEANEDYEYLSAMFHDCGITSARNFKINSFWVDNFGSSSESGPEFANNDCEHSGLRLEVPHNYTVQLEGQQAGTLYMWTVVTRTLRIMPNGLSWTL